MRLFIRSTYSSTDFTCATTDLPATGDKPGSGIKSSMPDVASLKWRGLELVTKSYATSASCATSASLRCIIRASQAAAS